MVIDLSKERVSIILPAYNEEEIIELTVNTITDILSKENIVFDILIIDDASTDNTWKIISQLCTQKHNVSGIKFSRNFGKESAISAGLDNCTGDCCVVMDCDLQHPPKTIIEMCNIWKNNDIHIVEGKKNKRQNESFFGRLFANLFYKALKVFSNIELNNLSDFKLLDRSVIDVIKSMPERQTFFRAVSCWVGFNKEYVYFDVSERVAGTTKWSFFGLVKLAINSITIYSALPMQIVSFCGISFFLFSIILSIQSMYMKLTGRAVEGFTTIIILLLIIGSIIMLSLGIIGMYLDKIYNEVKFRPKYIIIEKK